MGRGNVAKITISLPKELLDFADRLARERSTSRSSVIGKLLENEAETRIKAIMAEGYREMAEENRRMAEEAFPLVAETIQRYAEWNEPDNG